VSKVKKIRGHVEIHAETRWADREGEEGVKELVCDAFRIEHRDGSVEFASTPQEALLKVTALDERARRKVERKDPNAQVMWVTTIEWHNCPVGFEAPSMQAQTRAKT
jgi:hypothetical protein